MGDCSCYPLFLGEMAAFLGWHIDLGFGGPLGRGQARILVGKNDIKPIHLIEISEPVISIYYLLSPPTHLHIFHSHTTKTVYSF